MTTGETKLWSRRDVPVDPDGADVGPTARAVMPHFAQVFVAETMGGRAEDRKSVV